MMWRLSSSADPAALRVVDGLGELSKHGPHYSRQTPGSKTFTGVGQEIVLLSDDGLAVWAVVRQRHFAPAGSPTHTGMADVDNPRPRVWRNMLFRNLGPQLSSDLIKSAVCETYKRWPVKYGDFPSESLRTEIDPAAVNSRNPGYCFKCAGFHTPRPIKKLVGLDAPCVVRVATGVCGCCPKSTWGMDDTRRFWIGGE